MKDRCLNPNSKKYPLYGGRDITVCEKWLNFVGFLEDMGDCPDTLTLERVDSNKGYNKENCRWASSIDQGNNTSSNVHADYLGETMTIAQLSKITGLHYEPLRHRIRNLGLSVDEAVAKGKVRRPRRTFKS